MKEENGEKDKLEKPDKPDKQRKVHVTVLYTSTAEDRKFVVEPNEELKSVVGEGYSKLGETPRANDQLFCHAPPRHDLGPYLALTLEAMYEKNICVRDNGHGKLEFEFDIDVDPGGAAAK
jgi:hypothetical protein